MPEAAARSGPNAARAPAHVALAAQQLIPKVRDRMNTHNWLVNIIVCVVFAPWRWAPVSGRSQKNDRRWTAASQAPNP